jgi:uncharacterized protein YdaT
MPWDQSYFPPSMRNLPPRVRKKAIEIANALLSQGYDEGKSIRIGIAQAKRWAHHESSQEPTTRMANLPIFGPKLPAVKRKGGM